jgi:hypothetical protein
MISSLSPRAARWLPVLVAISGVAAYWAAERAVTGGAAGLPLDDGWIHAQFARQLAAGAGLAYRDGAWVAGSTSPLWTALLSVGGGPSAAFVLLWGKLLGIVLLIATARLSGDLARDLGSDENWSCLAATLVAGSSWLLWASLSGMEVLLFAALCLASLRLEVAEQSDGARMPLALPCAALAALARPEGALLFALLLTSQVRRLLGGRQLEADRMVRLRRNLILGLVAAACIALPYALLSFSRSGSFAPSTLAVKTFSAGGPEAPLLQVLHAAVGVAWKPLPLAILLAGAGAIDALRRRGAVVVAWFALLPFVYGFLSRGPSPLLGNFGRYLFPWLPLVVILGILGAKRLVEGWPAGDGDAELRRPRWAAAAVTLLLLVPAAWASYKGRDLFARNVADVEATDVAAADWLRSHVDPRALLAVQDIGAIGYRTANPLLDLSGIVSPHVLREVRAARSPADPAGLAGMRRVLETERPDFVVVFDGWYPPLLAALRPVARFDRPQNITMAGARLLIAATPWCRYPLPSSIANSQETVVP